jgi:adenylate cyclase
MRVLSRSIPVAWLRLGDGRRLPLVEGQSWTLGRSAGCDLRLESLSVSRLHALVQRHEDGVYWLVDLGSRNGCFVNGRRVTVPRALSDGDEVEVGAERLAFESPASGVTAIRAGDEEVSGGAMHLTALASVLVVDLRGYAALARLLPESLLAQMLGSWFRSVGLAAIRNGSWARRYHADSVAAVWIHERTERMGGDGAAALRALYEMEAATSRLHHELPLLQPLRMGAGLSTGTAILGGRGFPALDEAVKVAVALESATGELDVDLALSERAHASLEEALAALFAPRQAQLQGGGPVTAWTADFAALREHFERTPPAA